jgi:DNA-binding LacI/PurR family transcriptional regulator
MQEEIKEVAEKAKPVYLTIAEEIAKDIEDGIYRPGDRIPSSKELSLKYRIHRNSILPVFKILKNAKLLEVRKGIGMVVAEKPKPTTMIAVIIPEDYYNIPSLLEGIKETCDQNKAKIELITYSSMAEKDGIIMGLPESKYTGVILHPKFSDESEKELLKLKNTFEFPIALLGRPDQQNASYWQVERNYFYAGYIATEHLLEHHFSKIGIVVSKYSYDVAFLNGYDQAMREYEAQVKDIYIQYVEDEDLPGDATRQLLAIEKRPPKAIIYAHPENAIAGLEIMRLRDIVPGKNMGVVCYGDFAGSESYEPPITVVRYNNYEIGRSAAKLIFTYLSMNLGRQSYNFEKVNPELYSRLSSLKNGKEPICLSELQRQKRGLAMDRQARINRYWRDVYHPGWWKTEPGGWEREELYYQTLYNAW